MTATDARKAEVLAIIRKTLGEDGFRAFCRGNAIQGLLLADPHDFCGDMDEVLKHVAGARDVEWVPELVKGDPSADPVVAECGLCLRPVEECKAAPGCRRHKTRGAHGCATCRMACDNVINSVCCCCWDARYPGCWTMCDPCIAQSRTATVEDASSAKPPIRDGDTSQVQRDWTDATQRPCGHMCLAGSKYNRCCTCHGSPERCRLCQMSSQSVGAELEQAAAKFQEALRVVDSLAAGDPEASKDASAADPSCCEGCGGSGCVGRVGKCCKCRLALSWCPPCELRSAKVGGDLSETAANIQAADAVGVGGPVHTTTKEESASPSANPPHPYQPYQVTIIGGRPLGPNDEVGAFPEPETKL